MVVPAMTRDEAREAITRNARIYLQREDVAAPSKPSEYWVAIYAARVLCDHADIMHAGGEYAMCNICGGQT